MSLQDPQQIVLTPVPVSELVQAISKNIIDYFSPLVTPQNVEASADGIKYITRKDVCDIIGASLPTVLDYTKKGILKGYRIGRKVRYIETEVREALQKIQTV